MCKSIGNNFVNGCEMDSAVLQLLVLAAVAIFLVLRLRNVLGTRTGFEPGPEINAPQANADTAPPFEVIEGGIDRDIADHVDLDTPTGKALANMKIDEPGFSVSEFLGGARQAYEMILMAFEGDDLETLEQFLSEDVFDGFRGVIEERQEKGLIVEAEFVGVRELKIIDATFHPRSKLAELTIQFVGELTSVVKDASGKVVEGDPEKIKRQKDVWTFARNMGSDDPNWELVETGG